MLLIFSILTRHCSQLQVLHDEHGKGGQHTSPAASLQALCRVQMLIEPFPST